MNKSKNRFQSVMYAVNGLQYVLKESNFIIHIYLIVISFTVNYVLKYTESEVLFLLVCSGILLIAETINTSIEYLCDFIEPQKNEKIKIIKDISAGAVLLAGFLFFSINFIIVLPKIYQLINM